MTIEKYLKKVVKKKENICNKQTNKNDAWGNLNNLGNRQEL